MYFRDKSIKDPRLPMDVRLCYAKDKYLNKTRLGLEKDRLVKNTKKEYKKANDKIKEKYVKTQDKIKKEYVKTQDKIKKKYIPSLKNKTKFYVEKLRNKT